MKAFIIILSSFFINLKLLSQQISYPIKIETPLFKNLHQINDSIFRGDQPDSLDIRLLNE